MPTSKTSLYDVVIVGAGINGCASAYFLERAGLRVALVDQSGIAAGGSGAAGAFIAPKISKSGPLKEIMDRAHAYALEFYPSHFPEATLIRPLLHIAKTPEEIGKLRVFKTHTQLTLSDPPKEVASALKLPITDENSVYFERSAVVNAQKVCSRLAEKVDFYIRPVESLGHNGEVWEAAGIRGKCVLLAIGAYPKILPLPYMQMRAIWGHRIDIATTTSLPCILHHYVSISPTSEEGVMAIGATHDVHYTPFGQHEPYNVEAGRAELLEKASRTLKLENVEVLADYTGLRSGSNDYLPVLGPLPDAEETLRGRENGGSETLYYPNLFMVNGSGGYGFVLAPYLASRLCDHLTHGGDIDEELLPERFFRRWVKRSQS